MNRDELKDLCNRLGNYYGIEKYVDSRRLDQWLEKVKDIPSPAIEYIFSKITDEKDSIPRNIPRWMREYYHQWRSSSDQVIEYPRTDCRECGGLGLIWVQRPALHDGKPMAGPNGDLMEEVSYRCAKCENWKRHVHWKAKPAATKAELIEAGYRIMRLGGIRPASYRTVKEAAGAVGVPF